ncbi:hypothetical protein SLEP1_g26970 [Rubroshorea leprosula]|uniref:Peptidase M48 domain-containing protein n=1 Tax=Rubroshorea leprosula TaxID=152421 RepID=A0AAV5JY54_9ROSI|nr:hypothetical protein SLEP1_g26970 [Rubroshorea leprosula]
MAFNRAKRMFDSFCRNSRSRISGFSLRSPHSPKLYFPVCTKGNRHNTIYERFYRFRGRDEDDQFYTVLGPWRFLLPVGVLVFGVAFHANSEYVPFWERIHFLNLSRNMELKIGKSAFMMVKRDSQALPATDPSSLRVKSISQDIIEALQRGFGHDEQAWSDFRHDASTENKFGEETEGQTCDSNEILDDKKIEQSIKNQQKKSESIPNFEGIQWEVLVVDDPSVNAACLPGGKIILFSGALKQYASDAELATIIAREVL